MSRLYFSENSNTKDGKRQNDVLTSALRLRLKLKCADKSAQLGS